jgi:hypothetical protein
MIDLHKGDYIGIEAGESINITSKEDAEIIVAIVD